MTNRQTTKQTINFGEPVRLALDCEVVFIQVETTVLHKPSIWRVIDVVDRG
jgi:hypothetical protein